MLSQLFIKRKRTAPSLVPLSFLVALVAFVLLAQTEPALGLAGVGATMVVTAVLVELGRQRIWNDYLRAHKKRRAWGGWLSEPRYVYYVLNVWLLWPLM